MKGRTLVIGIILFVLIVVGAIYFAMMATINKIKDEGMELESTHVEHVAEDYQALIYLN